MILFAILFDNYKLSMFFVSQTYMGFDNEDWKDVFLIKTITSGFKKD